MIVFAVCLTLWMWCTVYLQYRLEQRVKVLEEKIKAIEAKMELLENRSKVNTIDDVLHMKFDAEEIIEKSKLKGKK